jgi:hypothetical protein
METLAPGIGHITLVKTAHGSDNRIDSIDNAITAITEG